MAISPSLVFAIDFSISSEDEITPSENFRIDIDSEETEIHDVKIFFRQSGDNLKSEIFAENKWKSTYYYIASSFPETKSYSVRLIEDEFNEVEICVRLRKSGQNSFSEQCRSLTLDQSEEETKVEEKEESKGDEEEVTEEKTLPIQQSDIQIEQAEEPTLLNYKENSVQYTTHGKTSLVINYLLAAIAFLALFLIAKRRHREI